jgi:hypothetical protein
MRISGWKHALALSWGLVAVATSSASAEKPALQPFADADHVIYSPAHGAVVPKAAGDVSYHNGGVIVSAKVVLIFWGPSFANAASADHVYAQSLQSFRNQLGTSSAWTVLLQYSGIQNSNLGSGTADWFDTSTPPTNVTDAKVRTEVNAYLASHAFDSSAIYEVVIPSTSYSSSGSSTSCGGPSLAYCAYHGSYSGTSGAVKYSIQPYPSCSGCKVSGWSDAQNQEHFICHETRDAVTDPTGGGWWDSSGQEICQKCAWSPSPFPTSPPAICSKAWSNAVHGCV